MFTEVKRLLVLVIALLGPVESLQADEELVLGVFPRRPAIETTNMFAPVAAYLSQQLGRPVRLETTPNFDAFWEGVKSKRYDLVHFNQLQYVKSHRAYGYRVILKNEEQGSATMSGVIAVHIDSPFHSLADLRGRTIVFGGGKDAMMAYVAPTALLRAAGLKPGDYNETFSRHPFATAAATLLSQADALGSGDVLFHPENSKVGNDISKLRILAQGKQLANLPWAVHSDMPVALRHKIQTVLMQLNETAEGRALLANAKLSGLRVAHDNEYNAHRRMIWEVLGEKY